MSNSLIPYSFIPGTKAKAQEVNANFIALADQITENKNYTDMKISETVSSMDTQKADLKLGNTTLVSNCILDAPNGIVTYTGNTITVKSGLKMLIPNGRNNDGTYKTIERSIEEDILLTTSKNDNVNCVYITEESSGTAEVYQYNFTTPKFGGGIWYNLRENKSYKFDTDTKTWEEFPCIVIATYENSADEVINVKTESPIALLKENDLEEINAFGFPDYANVVGKANGTTHYAKTDGYLYCWAEAQQNLTKNLYIEDKIFGIVHHPMGHIGWSGLCMPVSKGNSYCLDGGSTGLNFIPVKGAN